MQRHAFKIVVMRSNLKYNQLIMQFTKPILTSYIITREKCLVISQYINVQTTYLFYFQTFTAYFFIYFRISLYSWSRHHETCLKVNFNFFTFQNFFFIETNLTVWFKARIFKLTKRRRKILKHHSDKKYLVPKHVFSSIFTYLQSSNMNCASPV